MVGGPGTGQGGGWAEAGGAQGAVGVSVLPQGWVSSPATSMAVCLHHDGGCTCPGESVPQPITVAWASCAWLSRELGDSGGCALWVSAGSPSLFS